MNEEQGKRGCRDDEWVYPHGSEFCKDMYCIRCVDGTLEIHPFTGAINDLSEIW